MKTSRGKWAIALGWIAILGAVTVMLVIRSNGGNPAEKPTAGAKDRETHAGAQKPAFSSDRAPDPGRRERKPRPESAAESPVESRLRDLLAAGDLDAIHDELSAMADSQQLQSAGELLKTWCREGGIELAQWSLVLSEGEPDLNLHLCAAALSNPSEAIRELAASHLENASGITFQTSAQAEAWLQYRARP